MPRLAVLGQPVSHSRSPAMQNAALADLGLAGEWSYEAIEVAPEGFEALLHSLPDQRFAGVNVTVPHKLAALALADSPSEAAREIGAANTLTFADREIEAENTDATGVIAALPESPEGMRALVLGAGGSARACVWALRGAGAEVSIWNRTAAKAESLATEFGIEHEREAATGDPLSLDDYDLIANCTTVGLREASAPPDSAAGLEPLPLRADSLRPAHIVVDLAYGPAPTPLVTVACDRGARVVDGLEVLVHQGAASLRIWTGLDPPLETMRRAARESQT
ncbi:MAG: shikimate dehydrogenase [Solirubrobacterales bacterium]